MRNGGGRTQILVLTWLLDRLVAWPERLTRASLRLVGYQERVIETQLGDIAVLEAAGGGRMPLMLLHGFSAEAVHYAPLMRRLRPHVSRLYVPDLPAHGRSDPPAPPIHAGELREEVTEAFDRLLVEPTILYGNSLGGLVALDYALSRPEKVRGLILCSPLGGVLSPDDLEALRALFHLHSYADALAFVDRVFLRPHILRPLVAWGVRRKFAAPRLRALLQALQAADFLDPQELASLTVPTLLIWGKQDRILPRTSLEFLRTHLPSTVLIEEPEDASHTPYLEDPRGAAERILQFMRSLEPEPEPEGAGYRDRRRARSA